MNPIALDDAGKALKERHARWWQRKESLLTIGEGGPVGDLWLPLADGTVATEDIDVTPDVLDVDRLTGPGLEPGALEIHGDSFRGAAPFGRIPWVEAILGTPIRATIQGGSMRTMAFIRSWEEWESQSTHRDDDWFDLFKYMTELLVERSGGRYAVVQPTMRGPSDLAEAVVGPELLSFSLFEHQGSLRRFLEEATATFIEMAHALLSRVVPVEDGYLSAFGIWAPGTVVRTQCDASAFLSPKHYAEWFLPYNVRICESVDYSIIHLHSCSLHTADALLSVERPHALQITLESEPSGPPLKDMMPIFRKILGVKPLILGGPLTEDELKWVQDELPSGGLAINARTKPW